MPLLPVTSVLGVILPPGAGAGRAPPATDWTLRFSVRPWRLSGSSALNLDELRVTFVVEDKLCTQYIERLPGGAVVEFLCEGRPTDLRVAMASLVGRRLDDDELNQAALKVLAPVHFDDPELGTLTLNKDVDWFECHVSWGDGTVAVNLALDDSGDVKAQLALARILLADKKGWTERVQTLAASKLLELKNDNWLDEDESPLGASDFIEKLILESIVIYPSGKVEFYHDDGGLFWGHSIIVNATVADGPLDAHIAG